ncbi:hypothetical protein [Saccharomonospora viridis]|uniref:Uncharacterized protein n=2 Tax=Saccharomonospora viridis TaxID=1852 RepID=C7MVS9_SACVD|nr:hypothetical protein [Saccharomonospora viridis]ACU97029.1 hypothetical protein Svir_20110 [Saccharomonospora viridis DSM 43017]KHF43256.1 hypothetical protein MINT15_34580 [Saccharomonospora viridis]SFO81852.1 hypothetical protein SAMN02982918_0324 [Saccharomonospora viridis]
MLGTDTVDRVFATYLNDHHALAVGGAELTRRLASHQRDSEHATELAALRDDVREDLHRLRQIMATVGVPVRAYKSVAACVAEKFGRWKLNGRLLKPSPSSPVLELEGVTMLLTAKAGLWRSLRARARGDGRMDHDALDELARRADQQLETARRLHTRYAEEAFG